MLSGFPVPQFDGCDECVRLHTQIEEKVNSHDSEEALPAVKLIKELIHHVAADHAADLEMMEMKEQAHLAKVRDHASNPIVRAFDESGEEREPAFEGDSTRCGLDTVRPDEQHPWVQGYCEHLINDVYPGSLSSAGWENFGAVMRALVDASFYGGVYAERNRLLSEPIAL